MYTRHWADAFKNSVLFSFDYRLAPESKFPDQLEDCWQAHTWIIENAKEHLKIDFKKVIISGDSAGGGLAISLTLMAIKR